MPSPRRTSEHASQPNDPKSDASDARPTDMPPAAVDVPRIERAVREILLAVGEDPDREGLLKTPNRVARAYGELMAGLRDDPRKHLKTVFHERYDEVVLLRDIEFHSLCEHHLLPFTGRAHVAYLPDGKVVGLSKLARLVEGFARRPQVQERLTTQIADALMEELNPVGAACVIEAVHTCMTIRGAKKHGSTMVTSALRGIFKENPASRAEILSLMYAKNGAGGDVIRFRKMSCAGRSMVLSLPLSPEVTTPAGPSRANPFPYAYDTRGMNRADGPAGLVTSVTRRSFRGVAEQKNHPRVDRTGASRTPVGEQQTTRGNAQRVPSGPFVSD